MRNMPQSLLRKILNVEHAEDFTGHYVHVSAKHVKSLRDTIIFNFQKFLSIKSESNAIFTHPREDDFGRMKTNMFLSFRLNSRDVTAPPFQVYGGSSYKEGFINKCFNGSVFSMLCLEVKANTSHLLAPKVDRSFRSATKPLERKTMFLRPKYKPLAGNKSGPFSGGWFVSFYGLEAPEVVIQNYIVSKLYILDISLH